MSFHQLYDFDMECDTVFPGAGCKRTLTVKGLRGTKEAAAWATDLGWEVFPPSPFDEDRVWTTLCPECRAERELKLAQWNSGKTGG